jgi:ferredoxin
MDVTNSLVNANVNIYGLCDKQLACTTCRVDIESHQDILPQSSEEELDVLLTTRNFKDGTSRMACQIFIKEEMEGMLVRIQVQAPLNNQKKS